REPRRSRAALARVGESGSPRDKEGRIAEEGRGRILQQIDEVFSVCRWVIGNEGSIRYNRPRGASGQLATIIGEGVKGNQFVGIEIAGSIDADQGESRRQGVSGAANVDDIRIERIDGQALVVVAHADLASWPTSENIHGRSQVVIGRYVGL